MALLTSGVIIGSTLLFLPPVVHILQREKEENEKQAQDQLALTTIADAKQRAEGSLKGNELAISPLNAENIEKTTLGQYLASVNTDGTFIDTIQRSAGFEPGSFSALDAAYIGVGAAGIGSLFRNFRPCW